MKKIALFIMSVVLFFISACSQNTYSSPNYTKKILPSSKELVDSFLSIVGKMQSEGLFSGYNFEEKFCYNVTTDNVRTQTSAKIFKFSDSGASFIMIDETVHELCSSLGGYGFINAVPCDFDNDGNKDLLIASSWGSGMHRSEISIFNTKTKQTTIVYETSAEGDLMVRTSSQVVPNVPQDELPTRYEVCAVDVEIIDGDLVNIEYKTTAILGHIKVENTVPIFVPQ